MPSLPDSLRLPRLDEPRDMPLREQVAEHLRHAFIVGDITPGVILSAPTLAEEFGISATPVREAMLDLATEGHVRALRYKGYRVLEFSPETRAQHVELRGFIEIPLMLRISASGMPDAQLQAARCLAEDSLQAAIDGDLIEFIRLDTSLHLGLLREAGNDVAVRHVRSLRSLARLTGLRALAEQGELEKTAREHLDIVDAIAERDPERMNRIIAAHLGHVTGVWA
ncbi:MAG: GntR family transcriptional regulator [Corynebacterium sp.]|uniref:GntR family transcriptional regulator n=1 Tax=Corynebacterium sp. TaxID=1720 RepID=UPI0026DFB66E|nr:GntR family transcriptional regulator [Corynebacterium sp.]MDO5670767.1 GntR family transcriptional regulator [Corynebacterium sp.]